VQLDSRTIKDAAVAQAKSVPPPEDPDTRTNDRKPAPEDEKSVRKGEVDAPGQTPPLALESDILDHFRADLRRAGVAGEERLASLVYLALTSRVLPWGKATERPISVIPKGTTSTGKSHVTQTTLRFFPESAYISLGSMSRKYLFYSEENFAHRFIIVPEWASIADDEELVALLRTLLSEGRVIHGTVDGDSKRTARRIEKEGPTGLIVTTTRAAVDPEMETRCLSLVTDDTPEQTRRVYDALADLEENRGTVDLERWRDLQTWIADHGETKVRVPFVRELAEKMPAGATRLRRDFVTLLCLVRAHAILYQAQRERDPDGRIIATVDGDYAPVRELVADLIAEGAEAGVSPATRETVEAVHAMQNEGAAHVSPAALSKRLEIGKSATYDRIKRSLMSGYLANEAAKDERGMKLVVGALLPGQEDFLPQPAALVRSIPLEPPGQDFGLTMQPEEVMSGTPGLPADPPGKDDGRFCAECQWHPSCEADGCWMIECRAAGQEPYGFWPKSARRRAIEVRRLIEANRPELAGRDDLVTPAELQQLAKLDLLYEQVERHRAA
jgi:hypothetical protein